MLCCLVHVSAKACPGLDPGWKPVRRQEHAPTHDSGACPDSEGTGHALVRRATQLAAVYVALTALSSKAHAHALAQRYDLPLPLGFFLLAAGAAVAVSFVILALFWRHDVRRRKPSYGTVARGTVPDTVVVCCEIFGVGILALIVAAGLFGNPSTFRNIAPVAVWVVWWVGLSFLSAFVGNIWALINPWSAAFRFAEFLVRPWLQGLS